jgi:outer membrane receptor for ferrienterochelin and colicins
VKGVMQLPGMSAGYTQILVDGEPPRGISVNDIPMNTIERVEIYRLGSAEFSSQAIAGTINIILKKVPNSAQQQIKVNLSRFRSFAPSVEWMSSDKHENLSYSLSLRASEFSYSLPIDVASYEYDKQDQLLRQDFQKEDGNSSNKSFSVNPIIQYKGKDGFSIRSSTSLQGGNGTYHSDRRFQFLQGRSRPIQDTFTDNNSRQHGGNSSLKITDQIFKDIKLDLNVSINGNVSNADGTEVNYSNPAQLAFIRNTSSTSRSGGASSTMKLTAPSSEEHDIVGGWTISTNHTNDKRLQVESGPLASNLDASEQTTHSVVDNLAFFVQDEWKFKKASSAYFGLRWEAVRVQSDGNTQSSVKNTSSVWSPIVQTLWQLNPENSDRLRIGISRTYKAPNNFFLTSPKFIVPNNSIENPSMRGNPSLKPELAWSLQTSYEHNDKQDFSYSIKAVIRKITDVQRMEISYFEGAWWRRYVNAGEGLSKVLSIDTQFPLKRFWADSPNINLSFYAGRTWSSVSFLPKPDNLLVPGKHNANMSIDYTAKDLPLTFGGSVRYQDSHPILQNSVQRNVGESEVNVDVYALWKLSKKTKLRLSIDDLLKPGLRSSSQILNNDSTIWRYNTVRSYRYVRLNLEHNF